MSVLRLQSGISMEEEEERETEKKGDATAVPAFFQM